MFNFDGFKLQELDVVFSEYDGEPRSEDSECPSSDHQHIRLVWAKEGFPNYSIHAVGNPDDGSEWAIHSQTELLLAQDTMAFLQGTLDAAGIQMDIVPMGPDGQLPARPQADTDNDEDDPPMGMYL